MSNRGIIDRLRADSESIVARYLAGETMMSIAKDYGSNSASSISRLLAKCGIPTRPAANKHRYKVNDTYFDKIDTPNKAYVLGFMMADGCNQQDIGRIRMEITDEAILSRMASDMRWTGPIRLCAPRNSRQKTCYRLTINSRRLSDDLARLGCVQRKTHCATFPSDNQVPPEFHRHLIRGWMDGDGCISHRTISKRWRVDIVGTKAACDGFAECVQRHLGFPGRVRLHRNGKTCELYGFIISANHHLSKFLNWIYDGADLLLQRKRDKAEQFFADYALYCERWRGTKRGRPDAVASKAEADAELATR